MAVSQKIGKYEILEELSHGSITSVFKAFQPDLKRVVLVKRLHQKLVQEEDIRDRFFREAQVYAQINHPNIVSVFDFHSSEDGTYLVLEYIKGNSLAEMINGKPFPLEVSIALISELLDGLKYAHEKGIVHRDIKPDNLLISDDGVVKVSDFGLAVFEGATSLTRQGMVVGTPAYMSPEQAAGKKIDKNSDIFSLGIVFFELLTGVNPYKADSFSACIKKIISDSSPKLIDYRSDLPLQLEKIIGKMLEKNPAKRYQKCDEVLEDIRLVDLGTNLPSARDIISLFYRQRDDYSTSTIKVTSSIARRRAVKKKIYYALASFAALITIVLLIALNVFYPPKSEVSINGSNLQQYIPVSADSLPSPPEDTINKAQRSPGQFADISAQKAVSEHQQPPPAVNHNTKITSEPSDILESPNKLKNEPQSENNSPNLIETPIVEFPKPVDQQDSALAAPAIAAPGELVINCYPWADVYLDGKLLGQPPFAQPFEISPGSHLLQFIRPDYPVVTQEINIFPAEKSVIDVNLWEHLGVLKVSTTNTWAEIWIDGKIIDRTPRADPIYLSPGSHKIELRNPEFEVFRTTIEFQQGKKEPEILTVTLIPKK